MVAAVPTLTVPLVAVAILVVPATASRPPATAMFPVAVLFVPESVSVPVPCFVRPSVVAPPLARFPERVVLPAPATTSVWAPPVPPVPPEMALESASRLVRLSLVSVKVAAEPSPSRSAAAIV